jgi:hypothetical protein
MSVARPSEWPALFDIAIRIFEHIRDAHGLVPPWSFGGGTALMLQIDHRESHDIDLFIDDPQILPYLNPQTQSIALNRHPDSYESAAHVLKLAYEDLGEIDFICCRSIINNPVKSTEIRGETIALETPAEIIAKKIYFRGGRFQPRDMFDLAAVAEYYGSDYVISALSQCGHDACEKALGSIEQAKPAFVEQVIRQLMLRESTRHLAGRSRDISLRLLRQTLCLTGA